MGSGSVVFPSGGVDGDPCSGEIGELSSIMSWVERFLGVLVLIASAGAARAAVACVAGGLGVAVTKRRGTKNWLDPCGLF